MPETKDNHHTTFACVNFIIDRLTRSGVRDLTNLKLQKLLYFAYGLHLALFDKKLFNDEFEAWQYGPVLRSVYKEFKNFGKDNPIDSNYRILAMEDDEQHFDIIDSIDDEEKERSLLYACLYYGSKTAWQLVDILHDGRNSAWNEVYEKGKNNIIPFEKIKNEFGPDILDKVEEYISNVLK
ncbi:hypothetical protein LBMAG18_06250 [Alphaproteobacteria bacterium]|nr:hypothetical protein LBMAG18_06250 [Alphaproteobacteria bacterium]